MPSHELQFETKQIPRKESRSEAMSHPKTLFCSDKAFFSIAKIIIIHSHEKKKESLFACQSRNGVKGKATWILLRKPPNKTHIGTIISSRLSQNQFHGNSWRKMPKNELRRMMASAATGTVINTH